MRRERFQCHADLQSICTFHQLAKSDQDWFFGLKAKLSLKARLELWFSDDIETMLVGDAEILRKTYFGDLLLLPAELSRQHELSVAPIRARWFPEVHQTVEAERTVRRMLGEAASWNELAAISRRLLDIFTRKICPSFGPRGASASVRQNFWRTSKHAQPSPIRYIKLYCGMTLEPLAPHDFAKGLRGGASRGLCGGGKNQF
jgi:hypothetical protein